jgi:BirA family biotin operon repressor/biotin-[acetyl-CoA-carboxylase] ligase
MDKYNIDRLEKELGESGYDFSYFPELDTTMRIVLERVMEGMSKNFLVLTDHQTEGVGREGRVWMDTPNCSLMFSVMMRIQQSGIAVFADMVMLVVAEAIERVTGVESIRIKYPNDLVIDDKKVGGLLVKNIYDENSCYLGTNIGIGINVHYEEEELKRFPTDYQATSLDAASKQTVKREEVLIEITKKLRYLPPEVEVINVNNYSLELYEKKWRKISGVLRREIMILKGDRIIERGKVVDVGLGRGVELQSGEKTRWFSLFETDMKVRLFK